MSNVDLLFLSKLIINKRENDKKEKKKQDKTHVLEQKSLTFPKQEIGSHYIVSNYFTEIY